MTKIQSKKSTPKITIAPKIKKRTGGFTSPTIIPQATSPPQKIPIDIQKRLLQGNLNLVTDQMYLNLKTAIKEEIRRHADKILSTKNNLTVTKWKLMIDMLSIRVKMLQKTTKSSISSLMEALATKKTTKGSIARKITIANKNFSKQHELVKNWCFEQISAFLTANNLSN